MKNSRQMTAAAAGWMLLVCKAQIDVHLIKCGNKNIVVCV